MKTLILFILFTILLSAQPSRLMVLSGGEFSPADLGTDLKLWYKGDVELTTSAWGDQSLSNNDISFTNAPTVTGTQNGLTYVDFNGTDEYGSVTSFSNSQPLTIYLVLRQDAWVNNRPVVNMSVPSILQQGGTPGVRIQLAAGGNIDNPDLATDTWGIFKAVFDDASSSSQVNNETAATGDLEATTGATIFNIATNNVTTVFTNISLAEILFIDGTVSAGTDTKIKNYLAKKWGVTL